MTRPKLDGTEKKTVRLTVRVRPRELEDLLTQAQHAALTVSELMRCRALGKTVLFSTDLKVLNELRRLGGLIKHLFNETNGLYGEKTAAVLDELHAAAVRIGREREEG